MVATRDWGKGPDIRKGETDYIIWAEFVIMNKFKRGQKKDYNNYTWCILKISHKKLVCEIIDLLIGLI